MSRPGVFVEETVLPVPVTTEPPAAAAGAMLASLPSGPTSPTLVSSWYQFTRLFGPLSRTSPATFSANSFFRSGGRELYVCRIVRDDADTASGSILGDGSDEDTTADEVYLTFQAKSSGTYGNSLRVQVTKNARDLYDVQVYQENGTDAGTSDDLLVETFVNLPIATFGSSEVTDTINVRSQFINATWGSDATVALPTTIPLITLTGGSDGTTSGNLTYPAALTSLRQINRSMVVFSPGLVDADTIAEIQSYAADTQSFVVLDTAADLTADSAATYAATFSADDRVGVYFPHIWVPDTTSASQSAVVKIPPSGAVAGVILSTDATDGVYRAPAGVQASIVGAVALERNLTNGDLDVLNNDSRPVNALRVLAGAGPVVMGARTLDQSKASRYINIRRTLDYVTKQTDSLLAFALFRNNNTALWSEMSTVLDNFLRGLFINGGLRGNAPEDAYYIKIDAENNTATDLQNGIVNVEMGVALQYPAEFIKIQLTQQTLA